MRRLLLATTALCLCIAPVALAGPKTEKEAKKDSHDCSTCKDMEKSGLKLEQIDNMGKRKFPFNPRHVEAGHFVKIQFKGEPSALDGLRSKLRLNENVYQQYYQERSA